MFITVVQRSVKAFHKTGLPSQCHIYCQLRVQSRSKHIKPRAAWRLKQDLVVLFLVNIYIEGVEAHHAVTIRAYQSRLNSPLEPRPRIPIPRQYIWFGRGHSRRFKFNPRPAPRRKNKKTVPLQNCGTDRDDRVKSCANEKGSVFGLFLVQRVNDLIFSQSFPEPIPWSNLLAR